MYRYDDPEILAGQGTTALEIIEQMDRLGEKIDAVVIPVGGGGLLAGMATTLKHLAPEVTVIVRIPFVVHVARAILDQRERPCLEISYNIIVLVKYFLYSSYSHITSFFLHPPPSPNTHTGSGVRNVSQFLCCYEGW